MPPTTPSREQFLQTLHDSGLVPADEVERCLAELPETLAPHDIPSLAQALTARGKLTAYQADALQEGKVKDLIIGNYEVLEKLGAGGMGTVYKARHRVMKRLVALKILPARDDQDKQAVQRFQREVQVIAQLNHPNIVTAHDADRAEVGHYLVMELVEGRDLSQEIKRGGALPIAEAVDAVLQAARALEYAHGKGVVHRDIKPSNLLRDAQGTVKVADLGLARFREALVGPHDETSVLTQSGNILGTVDFMPPEQARDARAVDPRGDIYSLGCTLFYLVAGRPPYSGGSLMEILLKHRDAPLPSLAEACPAAPPALEAVFRKMTAKNLADRYQSMTEAIRDLEALSPGPVRPAPRAAVPPVPPPEERPTVAFGRRSPARHPTRGLGTLVLWVLLLAVLGGGAWWFFLRTPKSDFVGTWKYDDGNGTEMLLVLDPNGNYSLTRAGPPTGDGPGWDSDTGTYALQGSTLTVRSSFGERQFQARVANGELELTPLPSGGKKPASQAAKMTFKRVPGAGTAMQQPAPNLSSP